MRGVDEGRSEARGEALNGDLKKWGVAEAGPTRMAYGASPVHETSRGTLQSHIQAHTAYGALSFNGDLNKWNVAKVTAHPAWPTVPRP